MFNHSFPLLLPGSITAFTGEIDPESYALLSGQPRGECFAPDPRNTTGWILCDGSKCQIAQFQSLYQIIGNHYGGDPKEGFFQLPDFQGHFLRGLLPGQTQAPANEDRVAALGETATQNGVGSVQSNMVQKHAHQYTFHTPQPGVNTTGPGTAINPVPQTPAPKTVGLFDGGTSLSGSETRPQNIYVHYLIFAGESNPRLFAPFTL